MGFKFDKICSNKKGLTLIELLIAIFLFTFGLLGSTALTVTVIKGNHFARKLTEATVLAQDRMEQLKRVSYNDLTSGSDSSSIYGIQWTTQDNTPKQDMRTITVRVNWTDTSTHEVILETIRAR